MAPSKWEVQGSLICVTYVGVLWWHIVTVSNGWSPVLGECLSIGNWCIYFVNIDVIALSGQLNVEWSYRFILGQFLTFGLVQNSIASWLLEQEFSQWAKSLPSSSSSWLFANILYWWLRLCERFQGSRMCFTWIRLDLVFSHGFTSGKESCCCAQGQTRRNA